MDRILEKIYREGEAAFGQGTQDPGDGQPGYQRKNDEARMTNDEVCILLFVIRASSFFPPQASFQPASPAGEGRSDLTFLNHPLGVLGDACQPHQPERTQQTGGIEQFGRKTREDAGGDAGVEFGVGALRAEHWPECGPQRGQHQRPGCRLPWKPRRYRQSSAKSLPAGDRRRTRCAVHARQMADQQIGPAFGAATHRLNFTAASPSMPGSRVRNVNTRCRASIWPINTLRPRARRRRRLAPIVGTEHGGPPRVSISPVRISSSTPQPLAKRTPHALREAGEALDSSRGARGVHLQPCAHGLTGSWRWSSTSRCCGRDRIAAADQGRPVGGDDGGQFHKLTCVHGLSGSKAGAEAKMHLPRRDGRVGSDDVYAFAVARPGPERCPRKLAALLAATWVSADAHPKPVG